MTEREQHLEDLVDSLGDELHRKRLENDMLREALKIQENRIAKLEAAVRHTIAMFTPDPTEVTIDESHT
ncbi:MAG: hypothetical protein DMG02_26850 [Acidobacteria bacterium]|nr:MAG: hypothetical protein DMG02_26850 [Acidobacteriota bacterium]